MFKNLTFFRLPAPWEKTAESLAEQLSSYKFSPCLQLEMQSQGWDTPRHDGLVHNINGQYLLKLTTEKKLLPSSVVNESTKIAAQIIEEEQGFKLSRKVIKELKEKITDELLPRAFCIKSHNYVWIDTINGLLGIDSASSGKIEDVLKALLKTIKPFPIEIVRPKLMPQFAMTNWLSHDFSPNGFTIDKDTELVAMTESKARVKYSNHSLDHTEITNHISSGKQCTKLALTWQDKISFTLTNELELKSIKLLDILSVHVAENSPKNADESFDSDFALMAGEFALMLSDVINALGGEVGDLASPAGAPNDIQS